ncbi:MAG: class I SAM-dependent methyltransferase [Planctomycetia bacterium]|nr:class I SAM-dependent methyltransferase [Planctomycetia bacterium]
MTVRKWVHTTYPFSVFTEIVKAWLAKRANPEEVYDKEYFSEVVDPAASSAAPFVAGSIMRMFAPRMVIDVGCGSGAFLLEFKRLGASVLGLERATAALEVLRSRGIDYLDLDLSKSAPAIPRADLVISTEVAEHLPPESADKFVAFIASAAPLVVFTAATPGQGGTDHLNEQPAEYWVEKFGSLGFSLDEGRTRVMREEWTRPEVAVYYSKNLLIFRKGK